MDFTDVEKAFIRDKVLPDFDWTTFELPTDPFPLQKPVEKCRVALVATSGAYLWKNQEPFNTKNRLGDDSFRVIPSDTLVDEIALSHPGYYTKRAMQDLDCVFPLSILKRLKDQGAVGDVAPRHFSFMGYIPRTERLIWNIAPQVGRALRDDKVDIAILVPS